MYALPAGADTVVNDVSQLNPIRVRQVLTPTTVEEVVAAVKSTRGPISIGGGRFSMGGQTATDGALQLDMRRMDRIVRFSRENKEITVQPGITWRKLQGYIDPYDLSVQIMQSYANFTVGGALSVNVHGRYVGRGPIVMSVKSIRLVLANGDVIAASPTENAELFYGAIGGYGGLGVIVEATLRLTDNVRVERRSVVMPLAAYRTYFMNEVRNNPDIIFHNADLYPDAFDTVRVTSYVRTDEPVTVRARLIAQDKGYAPERFVFRVVSEWPGGKWIRQHVVDPWLFRGECIEWRNYEASYDVRELEPSSRKKSTYVLQEYFVPVDRLEQFVPKMADILHRHHVNVINVSIRHALPDPGTLLAWTRTEVFAYVLYYKQGTAVEDREAVRAWTHELIDAAIAAGGTYYLPYQILATKQEFLAGYPGARKFFDLKARVDPTNKFRNRLWDAYYEPPAAQSDRRGDAQGATPIKAPSRAPRQQGQRLTVAGNCRGCG
jgi:FAD/FMN-containing dehydrogenase